MATDRRGWDDLKAIVDGNRELQRENGRMGIPGTAGMLTCPNDGSILIPHPRTGILSCPMGDFTAPAGSLRR